MCGREFKVAKVRTAKGRKECRSDRAADFINDGKQRRQGRVEFSSVDWAFFGPLVGRDRAKEK